MTDKIRPPHYQGNGMQAIDVIQAFGLGEGFNLGNVIKYTLRYTRNGNADDLRKAKQYLEFELSAIVERQTKEQQARAQELAK
jgi:hypothetical protein